MVLKGLWSLSFLWLGLAAYQAQAGHGVTMILLLWAFALTMMAQRLLSYQRVWRNVKG